MRETAQYDRLRRPLAELRQDRRAVVAVETAIVGGIFIIFSLCLFELGFIFFAQEAMDYAALDLARQVQVGSAQQTVKTASQFRSLMCNTLNGMLSCDNIAVTMKAVTGFSGTGAYTVPTKGSNNFDNSKMTYCVPGPKQLMLINAVYFSPVWLSPFMQSAVTFNGSGSLPIVSTAAFMTENYPAASGPPCAP